MDRNGASNSLQLTATTAIRVPTCDFHFAQNVKSALTELQLKIVKAIQDMDRLLRVMILLHSAENYESVLRLYGVKRAHHRLSFF